MPRFLYSHGRARLPRRSGWFHASNDAGTGRGRHRDPVLPRVPPKRGASHQHDGHLQIRVERGASASAKRTSHPPMGPSHTDSREKQKRRGSVRSRTAVAGVGDSAAPGPSFHRSPLEVQSLRGGVGRRCYVPLARHGGREAWICVRCGVRNTREARRERRGPLRHVPGAPSRLGPVRLVLMCPRIRG